MFSIKVASKQLYDHQKCRIQATNFVKPSLSQLVGIQVVFFRGSLQE